MAESREAVVHEAATLSLKGIGAGLGVIVGGIALAIAVPSLIVSLVQAPANAPEDAAHPKIRPPVQELAPEDDMAAYRSEKMRRLESYGIDPQTGRAHIPIDKAMQMLVERSSAGTRRER
jgi:hypothetical protein